MVVARFGARVRARAKARAETNAKVGLGLRVLALGDSIGLFVSIGLLHKAPDHFLHATLTLCKSRGQNG